MEVARTPVPVGIIGIAFAVGGGIAYSLAPEKLWLVTLCEGLALVSLIAFFILHFETFKAFSARRSTRMGTNSIVMVMLFLAILGIANFLGARHTKRWDLSETQHFSLAPQTHRVLRNLSREVMLTVFAQDRSQSAAAAKDMMDSYREASTKLTVRFVDPERQPNVARDYGITKLDMAVVESGGQTVRVNNLTEAEITGALIRATKDTKKRLLFLEGHGERSLEDKDRGGLASAKEILLKQGYEVAPLSLLTETKVPDNTTAVVIAGPQRPITKDEQDRLAAYVAAGGHLLWLIDPDSQSQAESLLTQWGIEIGPGVVVDWQDRLAQGGPSFLLVRRFVQHDITQELKSFVLFPDSRFVKEHASQEWEFHPLAQTSPQSRAVMNSKGGVFALDDKRDVLGPLTLAAVAVPKKTPEEGKARPAVLVIGNSSFVTNAFVNFPGNSDFFLNSVNWLAQEPDLLSVPPKEPSLNPFIPNPVQERLLLYVQVLALPALTLAGGIIVWRKRRRL